MRSSDDSAAAAGVVFVVVVVIVDRRGRVVVGGCRDRGIDDDGDDDDDDDDDDAKDRRETDPAAGPVNAPTIIGDDSSRRAAGRSIRGTTTRIGVPLFVVGGAHPCGVMVYENEMCVCGAWMMDGAVRDVWVVCCEVNLRVLSNYLECSRLGNLLPYTGV